MSAGSPGDPIGNAASGLAADSRSLDQLRRAARDDPRQAVKKVATQFEALFMQMVLKSMREATPHSGLLDSQQQDMFRGMLDQQIAQQIAGGGTGLSEVIARQLSRNLPASAPAGAAAGGPAAAPAAGPTSAVLPAGAAAAPALGAAAAPSPTAGAPATAPANGSATTDAQRAFLQQHWSDAVRAQQLTGVPANFILGQAALESGWGQREMRAADGTPSYNLFGIKAGPGWQGRTVEVTTTEYEAGMPRKTAQSFRAYDSYASAFQDWALTIGRNPRYSAAASGLSAGGFALGMQQAGYSTDPTYGEKLARVIRTASSIGGAG